MKDPQFVPSEVKTKSTAALDKEVKRDLAVPDPTPEQAKAVLQPKEQDNE